MADKGTRSRGTVLCPPPRSELVEYAVCHMNDPNRASLTVPHDLASYMRELELWAGANWRETRKDTISFWTLKIPAIIASASAGLFAYYHVEAAPIISSAIATLCITIDGVHPRGNLRNIHLRAYHDIRILLSAISSAWRTRDLNMNEGRAAAEIIKVFEPQRINIAEYIRNAETSLNGDFDSVRENQLGKTKQLTRRTKPPLS
jgi:hypothetical protein